MGLQVAVQDTASKVQAPVVDMATFSRTMPPTSSPTTATSMSTAATPKTGQGDPRFDEFR